MNSSWTESLLRNRVEHIFLRRQPRFFFFGFQQPCPQGYLEDFWGKKVNLSEIRSHDFRNENLFIQHLGREHWFNSWEHHLMTENNVTMNGHRTVKKQKECLMSWKMKGCMLQYNITFHECSRSHPWWRPLELVFQSYLVVFWTWPPVFTGVSSSANTFLYSFNTSASNRSSIRS